MDQHDGPLAILAKPIPSIGSSTSSNGSYSPVGSAGSPFKMEEIADIDVSSPRRLCKVCGDNAHGSHFQVLTCRACAAFFRRTCQQQRIYRCRRATKVCDVSKNAPYNCRYCRYEKCKKMGMKYHTVLSATTELPSDVNAGSPASPGPQVSMPQLLRRPHADDAIAEHRHVVPVSFHQQQILVPTDCVERKVKEILEAGVITYGPTLGAFRTTTMQRMMLAYENTFAAPTKLNESQVRVVQVHQLEDFATEIKESCIQVAKFLMSFPQFAQLSMPDKLAIFLRAVHLFSTMMYCYPSIRIFGNDVNDTRVYRGNNYAVEVGNFVFTSPNMAEQRYKEMNSCLLHISDVGVKKLLNPMKELQITEYELVFIQILICWNVQSLTNISEEAKDAAAQVVEEVSNEIHNYYMVDLKMTNYASRLVKLLNLQIAQEEVGELKRQQFNMARLFKLFEFALLGERILA
ncbi:hypothetical protein QR680_006033 [Steinernema hermaphroditum]|uniref:Nuclear receptor domain-containing protein n=1 Tax=Steinernema hermaphroditum TaxID=289476 RepID=A0AA39HU14_9BILA|nr:hypothetical protein QR680_006033 [Steinernema hermaphroditum]